jgi:hypothetical protein
MEFRDARRLETKPEFGLWASRDQSSTICQAHLNERQLKLFVGVWTIVELQRPFVLCLLSVPANHSLHVADRRQFDAATVAVAPAAA